MVTFVLAPDSFKESMTAVAACDAMQRGIQRVLPNARCISVPMADGGEGTVDAIVAACSGRKISVEVTGPLPHQKVPSYLGLIDNDQTAVIEMALANGIQLLEPMQRNPLLASTHGTGELIRAALDLGVSKIIVGLGGSATNDAGAGMVQALGAQFFDSHQEVINVYGGNLDQIRQIDLSQLDVRLAQTKMIIVSDVNNPLCGTQGASYVFGPQKGADEEMVKILDQNLSHFADVVESTLNVEKRDMAGAGAAGGLGFGLMAFANAEICSGVNFIIELCGLKEKIAQADYVLTGEGKIDFQTKFGKTPFGVAQVAKRLNKPVIAFAGVVGEGVEELYDLGFSQIIGINPPNCELEYALKNAEIYLEKSCADLITSICKKSALTHIKMDRF